MRLIASGSLVVRVACALVIGACAPGSVSTSPPPAPPSAIPGRPTSTPSLTPTSLGSPLATSAPTLSGSPVGRPIDDSRTLPAAGCCNGLELEPAHYRFPPWTRLRWTIEVPDGWRLFNESAAGLFALVRGENALPIPSELIVFVDASESGAPAGLVEAIAAVPQVDVVTGPEAISLGDFDGVRADLVALPNPDEEGDPSADIPPGVQRLPVIERYFAEGFTWTTWTPEARIRPIALNIGGQTLLVYVEGPAETFDALAADAGGLLTTLQTSIE